MSADHDHVHTSFALAPAIRAGGVLARGGYQTHRDFIDFIVDGRPLLHRLSDLDAVSPLASDVPPAIFTDHVRRLLLDAEPPLAGGRYVIYGCPECEGIECGAVTAVIERDGDDIVWRDFAWQTAETADLKLNGYHGIGPFRFRGDEYRTELERLLPDGAGRPDGPPGTDPGPVRRRVLLIGDRVAVVARLAAALRAIGIGADIAQDSVVVDVPAAELRSYGAVAFGRAIDRQWRAAVKAAFARAEADVVYVDGLAPIVPLLVAQIEHALDRGPLARRRLTGLAAADGEAVVEVSSTCRVQLTAYRLDRLSRAHTHALFDGVLEPGTHRVPLDARAVRGRSFVVARTTGGVLVAPVAHRPAGARTAAKT
ncbi:oxidoreductase [Streptomyces sp. SP18CS02]|uniref:oxidoreductase n=1 Tax=Streptomyces sp. SP18CS02 TaxID=3002531 RepID=UPI002E75BC65|nr:oxidoreductase [Streptomyces sp. SP18CS02]MEE1754082.1 oxidoreductase [Streptomyces sp. SP18CS02]